MQIADAALVEPGGELVLGKAGAARGRHRAYVDQELDAGVLEFIQHRFRRRLLVADGEEFCLAGHIAMPCRDVCKGGYGTFRPIAITAEAILRRQAAALPTRA